VGPHHFSVEFRFPVSFTRNVFDPANSIFVDAVCREEPNRRHRLLVVVDDNVAAAHPGLLEDIDEYVRTFSSAVALAAPPLLVPGGETVKNELRHVRALLAWVNQLGIDRQSFLVAIGGGAVLDMVGFAAAIAHRGVRLIRLPTTVLAQADSGIAVKNGINLFGKKNFIGTFVPPFGVINDSRFLETLHARDRIAGLAEAVKVALIRDRPFFEYLEANASRLAAGDPDVLTATIQRSAELHLQHIIRSGDPFELASARPLDFGHWSAHKLESLTKHRLRHGEAVAIGMAVDLMYSRRMRETDSAVVERVLALLETIGFNLWDPALLERDTRGYVVLNGLQEFREHLGGELHIAQIRDIGASVDVHDMDESAIVQALFELRDRYETCHANRTALPPDVLLEHPSRRDLG
jgi:3-dehydroquinate synthase